MTATRTLLCAVLALSFPSLAADPLVPRPVLLKPARASVNADWVSTQQLVLKFQEGTGVRLRTGKLDFDPGRLSEDDRRRMARRGLSPSTVEGEVERANSILSNGVSLYRLLARSEEVMDLERPRLEQQEGEELADLNLYFMIVLERPDAAAAERVMGALNQLDSVEIAYAEPLPSLPAAVDIFPPTKIDVTPSQGYLQPAALGGIDALWAGRLPGGRGAGIKIIDVENGWTTNHEDMPDFFAFDGWNWSDQEHGVAVLGVLGAAPNAYGATGIVPDAALGASSVIYPQWYAYLSIAGALENAANRLVRGDVIVIEQHYPDPTPPGVVCACNCGQFGFLPVEKVQAAFDVIRNATARGIIVVEAGGNGSMNLDDVWYLRKFDRTFRDSRAIVVGAGNGNGTLAACGFSNSGSRVDLQGWGIDVATVGFGDLMANGSDNRQFYTLGFNGTSSATPIVAGAVAAVNGSRLADGLSPLDSFFMRQWLVNTGTPQAAPLARKIGPRPNLRAALPAVTGKLESVDASGKARGWAFHSGTSASIGVTFEIDGLPVVGTTANLSRADINSEFLITGQHGFEFQIPNQFHDDQNHVLRAIAVPPPSLGGKARPLGDIAFKFAAVRGFIDGVSSTSGVVSGWAIFRPSAISIQVYVRVSSNDPFNPQPIGFFTTLTPRSDVNAAFGMTGVHGFDVQLPGYLQDGQSHTVEVFGMHPNGGLSPLIGSKNFIWFPLFGRQRFWP